MGTQVESASRAETSVTGAAAKRAKHEPVWLERWWKLLNVRIGIVPLPIHILLLSIIAVFFVKGKVPGEISMVIGLIVVGGFTCGEIGNRIPVVRNIGGGVIFATFVPSYLVYRHWIPPLVLKPVTDFFESSNFLYLFITCIIVGSIFGMDRQVLIKGFAKIFVPLAVGSVAAMLVGTGVGMLLGMSMSETLLFTVIPIMAGGVGEGAIPLSIGYSEIFHQNQGELFARVLPSVMLGSLTAILLSGGLNYLGKRYPHLTGEGRLQPGAEDIEIEKHEKCSHNVDVGDIAAGGTLAISLYLLGMLCHEAFRLPAPVAMLFIAVLVKVLRLVSPPLQDGAHVVYKFFRTAVAYPILFSVGVAITPWDKLVAAFHPANVITIFCTVTTLMATGFFVGRLLNMYPIEAAIINATHSGQGGTGDIAILTASNRMVLMPFAQVSTRIGGAIIVTIVLIVLSRIYR